MMLMLSLVKVGSIRILSLKKLISSFCNRVINETM
jgi:hypothetical protein